MPGLFIRQLAEVVSSFCNVTVLYLHPDENANQDYEIISSGENGVHVIRVYYRANSSGFSLISRIKKAFRFFYSIRIGLQTVDLNAIDLVHVHILTRQGFIANLIWIFKRIPYVITEHWSRYLMENNTYKGFLRKLITRSVVRHAEGVIAVSEGLRSAMLKHGLSNHDFRVIPNSVNIENFCILNDHSRGPGFVKRIIHVSCFEDRSKNITGFLRIIQKISVKRRDFTITMVGEGPDWNYSKKYATDLGLKNETISFPGLKNQEELGKEFNNSDFLVLSSHYETFGIVIIEAMACGLPVVSTEVGIASSVITSDNGLLVPAGDEQALQEAVEKMLDHCGSYDRPKIRKGIIDNFNIDLVARKTIDFYNEVLQS